MAIRRATSSRTKRSMQEISDSVIGTIPEDEKVKKSKALRKGKAVAQSAEMTLEKITKNLTTTGLSINQALSSVRTMFDEELERLETVKEAITAKEEELSELFDKEIVASSIRDMVLQHEDKKSKWENNIEETRQSWIKELNDHTAAVEERNKALVSARAREKEEYEYNFSVEKRNKEEALNEELNLKRRSQAQKEEELNKAWAEREEILTKKEKEVSEAKDKLDNFDEYVKKESDKNVAIVTNVLKKNHEQEVKIMQLQFESEKKLLLQENQAIKESLQKRDDEIASLKESLKQKDSEVKEVAVAAMSAQSGKQALEAVQTAAQNIGNKR